MSSLRQGYTVRFVDNLEEVEELVSWAKAKETPAASNARYPEPALFIDLEGANLGRDGSISLITILAHTSEGRGSIYVIDIHGLGSAAFAPINGLYGLKDILESPRIIKVFFDVRNDSDALFAHYDIRLQGVLDIQLMENAGRWGTDGRKYIAGLSACVKSIIVGAERAKWEACKQAGERLWNPAKGGSYDAFNQRPLPQKTLAYCVGDVQYMPRLYRQYYRGSNLWKDLIAEGSRKRVFDSQQAGYQPHGPGRALSPWTAEQNRLLDSWQGFRPPYDDDLGFDDFGNDDYGYDDFDYGDDNDYEDWTGIPSPNY